jgi:hypothetical protein
MSNPKVTIVDIEVFKCLCAPIRCDCGHKYKPPHYNTSSTYCPKCGRPDKTMLNAPESTGPEHYGLPNVP